MATAHNETNFELNGQIFTLSFNFGAMRKLERLYRKPIGEILGIGANAEEGEVKIPISAEFIACALAAGLERHHPKLGSTAAVTRFLERATTREIFGSIQTAVVIAIMVFLGADPESVKIANAEASGGKNDAPAPAVTSLPKEEAPKN